MENQLGPRLLELNREAFKYLLSVFPSKKQGSCPPYLNGKLIFPKKRNGEVRLSEQELRAAYIRTIESDWFKYPCRYSIETPSKSAYSFSGEGERSAMSDLTLYDINNKVICNIECKARNAESDKIGKDIQKFIGEDVSSAWGHIIDVQNRGTLPELFKKFEVAFQGIQPKASPPEKIYFFSFGILPSSQLITTICQSGQALGAFQTFRKIFTESYDEIAKIQNGLVIENFKNSNWRIEGIKLT